MTRSPKTEEQAFQDFVAEFKNESDRAAVIIGAAKLDYLLFQILSKFMLPSTSKTDELLEGDSPLSTFSARIGLAFRLGLIDAGFTRALHMVRRLRNSFAHEISGCQLDTGAHRDRVREMVMPIAQEAVFQDFKTIFVHDKSGIAADFCAMLGLMALALEACFERVPTVSNRPLSLVLASYGERRVERDNEGKLVERKPTEA